LAEARRARLGAPFVANTTNHWRCAKRNGLISEYGTSTERLILVDNHAAGTIAAETKDFVVRTILFIEVADGGNYTIRATNEIMSIVGFACETVNEIRIRVANITGPQK
jgi:hypothetical protein